MEKLIPLIRELLPDMPLETHSYRGDETIIISPDHLPKLAERLHADPELGFEFLMDLTAVDYLNMDRPKRFEVVYHFYSLKHNHRLRVKVPVDAHEPVPTLSGLWKSADWYEREVYDMYGIRFEGHPNLKRLLLYDEFKGHPLRKDYPVTKRQPRLKLNGNDKNDDASIVRPK